MKKTAGILICLLILAGLLPAAVSAQSRLSGAVFVSIADQNGTPVLAYEKVSLSDMDRDGALTVNDVLMAAHKEHHRDGKEGFSSEKTQYGRSITKLWGVENGGSTKGAVIISDVSSDATMKVYLDDVQIDYTAGDELTEVGKYRIVLEDAAGNVSEYSFEILWKMPAVAIVLIVIAALGVVGTVVWLVISKKRKDEYYN